MTRFSPRFLQGFHKKIAWPTDTRFSMFAEPFRELVEFMICEFAILDNGVTGLETHFYRNHSWLFFKVFGLGGNGFWTIPRSATSSHRPTFGLPRRTLLKLGRPTAKRNPS